MKFGLDGRLQQASAVAVVVPEDIADQGGGEVDTGPGSGPPRTDRAPGAKAQLAVDEDQVAAGVDEVGSDEGEGDGTHDVHGLHAAADGEIEKKRKRAPSEGFRIGNG